MREAQSGEQQLMSAADSIALTDIDLAQVKARLHAWLAELTQALAAHQLHMPAGMRASHALAQQAGKVNALIATSAEVWERQWEELEPARQLARAFEDRVMLLVFGKTNAGKSSLCNFLASRFAEHGHPVSYFHVHSGRIVETTEPLREGAVETTARVQGVCLGANLVLLDTPGLHSATPENSSLTQRFTDSADALLWLTSSTSPGQIQELDELPRELHRGRPLLPIITRSDVIEEDEVDGKLVKLLRNKCPASRQLQENDVRERGRAKLRQMGVTEALLQPPISLSVHTARERGCTAAALSDSGFAQLWTALLAVIEPAKAYKQRKPASVLLHHLEENVLDAVERSIQPDLHELKQMLSGERALLREMQPQLKKAMRRQVLPELPNLLERHQPRPHKETLCSRLGELLQEAVSQKIGSFLVDYEIRALIDLASLQFDFSDDSDYQRLYERLEERVDCAIATVVDDIISERNAALDRIELAIFELRNLMGFQIRRLADIRLHMRDANTYTAGGP